MSLENLSNEKLINGIKKCIENGESLLDEAYLLSKANKFARDYTLCQLAIEEFSKSPLLYTLLMEKIEERKIDYKKYNKMFNDHFEKTELSIYQEIAMFKYFKQKTGEDSADELIKESEESLTKVKELNALKNESLYVSIKNNNFQLPLEAIDEGKYNSVFVKASLRRIMLQKLFTLNEKDIDEIKKGFEDN